MNNQIESIRALVNGNQPTFDISEMLYKHGCYYLLSKINSKNELTSKVEVENILNKLCITQRFKTCTELFHRLNKSGIPYAVIKGAVLSSSVYNDPFCRHSGDMDILICRQTIDNVKQILLDLNFIQGKITESGISPFSRQELLFQTALSHQTAPFIKETDNKFCPYVNVDINLDIMWGESGCNTDMQLVLEHTDETNICGITIKRLCPEMEFISLCLHHYKDMNSLYLLYERGLRLSHYCDIYFFIKNRSMNLQLLCKLCDDLNVGEYIYYCLYHTDLIFDDGKLKEYMFFLRSETADALINKFGLADNERQTWQIDFFTRLFDIDLRNHLKDTLEHKALTKIRFNQTFM